MKIYAKFKEGIQSKTIENLSETWRNHGKKQINLFLLWTEQVVRFLVDDDWCWFYY
jgi:hypothetical protein